MSNKKYIIYTIVTFIIMSLLVLGAHNMSSENKTNTQNISEEQVEQNKNVDSEEVADDTDNTTDDEENEADTYESEETEVDIPTPPAVKSSVDNNLSELQPIADKNTTKDLDKNNKLIEAFVAKHNGDYQKAIEYYNSLLENSSDNNSLKAICYESLAEIYAKQKRYGTAIVNAQKAYSTEPTPSRKFLQAKIYFKAGEVDKAKQLTNTALESDF